ncbi:MAG: MBL fold metallo-hydrolase [Deltaproteobacteria bacterium]|nr:MBL fold metallo-hydrolase [Deltaproteobacteria bacterium]
MSTKIVIGVLCAVISVLIILLFFSVFTWKSSVPVVRMPDAPGASTIQYTPPPRPKFAFPNKEQLANIRAMSKKTIEKVMDGIYIANNYALGNVVMVETAHGLVIVDTTENAKSARQILAEFRKITGKPVKTIIYTHGHVDHIFGTPVFKEAGTQIIATRTTVEFLKREQGWMEPFLRRSRQIQSGSFDEDYALKIPIDVRYKGFTGETLVWPTVTFDKYYTFKQDDTVFELYETGGEAPGHLIIRLPQKKLVISGDLFYASFPNLSTPMLAPRSAEDWIAGLEKILNLDPDYLAPCHGLALRGRTEIRQRIGQYRDATKYIHDETIKAINAGKTVEEAVRTIRLPDQYARLPDLREGYGRVDWAVRGIYHCYTGWYDGRGAGLNPLPAAVFSRELIQLSGGVDKVLTRAIKAQKLGEHQLAVELADLVIKANPDEKTARIIKSYSLDYLGYLNQNLNMFGFYRSAAAMERKKAGYKP